MKTVTTKRLVMTALFTTLVLIATMFIRIPIALGYVNLGDAFILLAVFILGPIYGTIAAGLGSGLADLFGYITYAPGTLIIKSLMAFLAWLVYAFLKRLTRKEMLAEIAGGIVGATVMAFGYFAYETLLFTTAAVAIVNVPWNLLQGAVGVALSVAVMRVAPFVENKAFAKRPSAKNTQSIDFFITQKGDKLRILQLSDMQVIDASQKRYSDRLNEEGTTMWDPKHMDKMLFEDMDALVEKAKPDLILITGDIIYGEFDDKGSSMLAFVEKMESYKIPWAPVWGNHDNECVLGVDWQCQQFENAKHCLFKKGTTDGCSNYILGIQDENGELLRLIYMADTNGCANASPLSLAQGVIPQVGFTLAQTKWMQESYEAISTQYQKNVPSFVCFHIEVIDYLRILQEKGYYNPDNFAPVDIANGEDFGDIHERMWAGENPIEMLPTFHAIHTDGTFFGHSHVNDASVVAEGIRWSFGLKTGMYDYHEKEKLGGALIILEDKASKFTVERIRLKK